MHSDTVQRLRRYRIAAGCDDESAKAGKAQRTHLESLMGDPHSAGRHESSRDPSLAALRLPGVVFLRNFEELAGGSGACCMRWLNSVAFSLWSIAENGLFL